MTTQTQRHLVCEFSVGLFVACFSASFLVLAIILLSRRMLTALPCVESPLFCGFSLW